jgi:hypothetical protein
MKNKKRDLFTPGAIYVGPALTFTLAPFWSFLVFEDTVVERMWAGPGVALVLLLIVNILDKIVEKA